MYAEGVRFRYNRYSKVKAPFLVKNSEGKTMNGDWDVSDTVPYLRGIRTGEEEIKLADYLVHRPLPKALLDLRDKPEVHPHSYEMQKYYQKLQKVMEEGYRVDGEYYNPFFCFWIVMFVFEIPRYDSKGNPLEGSEMGRPLYSTIDRYIFDCLWKAYKTRTYPAIMGGRGLGKSYITNCIAAWFYMLFDDQEMIVSATSDPIVEEAWSKFTDTIDQIEKEFPGFKQKRSTDSNIRIIAGEEYYDHNNDKQVRGSGNDVRRITYGTNPNVTRGRRPHFQHIEEFASFPSHPSIGSLKNCLSQSKGSWKVFGNIMKAFVMMTGTGGSVNNKDAEGVFTNPKGYNLFEVNEWGKPSGIFIPAFLKYGGTWEANGVPNIELAKELMIRVRKTLEEDPIAYLGEIQEFPMTLEDVFTLRGTNLFNQDKIAEQITKLSVADKKYHKEGKLEYILDSQGQVVGVEFKEVKGGDFIIVEEPEKEPDGTILNNLYVAGIDSIDQGKKDSLIDGSKLACAIKKRMTGKIFSTTSNLYSAFYCKRSDDVRWDYENVLKLLMYYNAKANLEYTKINIVSFFRDKNQLWRLLKRPSIAIGANVSGAKASTLIGTPANPSVIGHQDQKLADYIDDYYYQIMYLPVLEQMRDYTAENRTKFDYVVACGLAELADEDYMGKPASAGGAASEDLTMMGMYRNKNGKKRWGVIPKKDNELKSIAEEELEDNNITHSFRWLDTGK